MLLFINEALSLPPTGRICTTASSGISRTLSSPGETRVRLAKKFSISSFSSLAVMPMGTSTVVLVGLNVSRVLIAVKSSGAIEEHAHKEQCQMNSAFLQVAELSVVVNSTTTSPETSPSRTNTVTTTSPSSPPTLYIVLSNPITTSVQSMSEFWMF